MLAGALGLWLFLGSSPDPGTNFMVSLSGETPKVHTTVHALGIRPQICAVDTHLSGRSCGLATSQAVNSS